MYGDSRILGKKRDSIARYFGANSKKQRERLIEQSEKRKDELLNKRDAAQPKLQAKQEKNSRKSENIQMKKNAFRTTKTSKTKRNQ